MRTLLIDNHDSFTYNLFQLMAQVYGECPYVVANDEPSWDPSQLTGFDALVISPGPGHPEEPRNLGLSLDVLRQADIPVLGVCLGHQAIAYVHGSSVKPAPVPRHGHLSRIRHDGQDLFEGIPQHFTAVRYHSLCVPDHSLAPGLQETAWAEDGVLMGLKHVSRPLWGVQFHPESVLSDHGARLLRNFEQLAGSWPGNRRLPQRALRHAAAAEQVRTLATGAVTANGGRPAVQLRANWQILHREIPREIDAGRAFATFFAQCRYAFWLDSSRTGNDLARFSFLGAPLGPHGEVLSSRVGCGTAVEDAHGSIRSHISDSIFKVLADRIGARRDAGTDLPFDFDCGYVGYIGYEMKAELGSANSFSATDPDAMWISATRVVAIDHEHQRTYLLALARRADEASIADAQAWLRYAQEALAAEKTVPVPGITTESPGQPGVIADDPEHWLRRPEAGYVADIAECLRQLHAGESYEICLTTMAAIPFDGDPLSCYLNQRRHNPAPYAAYLQLAGTYVLCSSPERFIKVSRDRRVESRPIKGTAPRDPDLDRDGKLASDLASDPKSRAENLMIVDLLRNDLGRVCEVGSVTVPRLMQVESYATVHQLVSTIQGQLREDVGAVACVRSCFPGGSMTGAPKERTMEILDHLENGPRGIYSGCLGYFSLNGTADLSIVIRTAVIRGGWLRAGAGGAIVLGSVPADEYAEMLLKARAPLRGMTVAAPVIRSPPLDIIRALVDPGC